MAFPTGWGYKQKITIDNTKVSATLSNFPVLVDRNHLHDDVVDPSGSNNAQANGGDVRFSSDAAGTTQLACEVVEFEHDTSTAAGDAQIQIWVKVPSVSSSVDTDIYIWYDTAGADTQPAVTDTYGRNNVWSANYLAVYHLEEDPGSSGTQTDSTGNGNTLTCTGMETADSVASQIGNGLNFDNTVGGTANEYATRSGFVPTSSWKALLTWMEFDSAPGSGAHASCGAHDGSNHRFYTGWWNDVGTNKIWFGWGDGFATNTQTPSTGTKYQFGMRKSATDAYGYLDATLKATLTSPGWSGSSTDDFHLGTRITSGAITNGSLDGKQDETHIFDADPGADWFTVSFNNHKNPSTFASSNTPVAATGDTNVLATTDALTLTEHPATVNAETNVLASADTLTLTEYAATVSADTNIQAIVAALTLTEYVAAISLDRNILATTDALTLAEQSATIVLNVIVEAGTDALTLTEQSATISVDTNVLANTDALVLTTYPVSFVAGVEVLANTDALALTTYPADIIVTLNVNANTDALTLTTHKATILVALTNTAPINTVNSPVSVNIGHVPQIDDPQVYEAVLHVHSAIDAILIEQAKITTDYSEIISELQARVKASLNVRTITADYELLATDGTIKIDASTVMVTATLPSAVGITGTRYVLKCIDDTYRAFVATIGAEEIDGSSAAFELYEDESIIVQSDGTNWIII